MHNLPETLATEPTTPFDAIERLAAVAPPRGDFPFQATDFLATLHAARALPRTYFAQVEEARARGRRFAEQIVRPLAVAVDRRVAVEPGYFAWHVLRDACRHRLLSLMVPVACGGSGYRTLPMAVLLEEIAAACAGFAATIGVHCVASGLIPDPYLLQRHVREMVEAEGRGEPMLWSGAITEPGAGTDIWDADFLRRAQIGTFARRVPGGYRLTGRKCFISNGSVARWSLILAALDPRDVARTWSLFVVRTDSRGFSIGRVERKMGQKASPAAELILDDVFVPAAQLVGREGDGTAFTAIYLAGSRGPVGALGVGCARRALECLVEWAAQRRSAGGRLIDQQWIQMRIAAMARDIYVARHAYVAAGLAFDEIMHRLYDAPPVRIALRLLPRAVAISEVGRRALQAPAVKDLLDRLIGRATPPAVLAHAGRLAAMAKIVGSDVGVRVSGEALAIMGADAYDPRWPVEKCYRDAKLTQIYEGTNQANAITQFKSMAATWAVPATGGGNGVAHA
jgi:alkylation response protein AidB-like acyl-CoA dehydrogenase